MLQYDMNITKAELEKQFEPYILKCRTGDWAHAKRVVAWIEELGQGRDDLSILIIAGYIHDIGWSGLVKNGEKLSKEELLKIQPQADKQTETLVKESIAPFGFSNEDVQKILRLIKATETYVASEDDEEILVDSDNLSKTNPDHVREKYKKEEWLNMCTLFEEKLPERIKTKKGKELFVTKLAELRSVLEAELKV